nr:MAG: DNA gyrase subunit A [actinobacterium acMicro-1]
MTTSASTPEAGDHITDIDLAVEMQDSFLEYAYSVIYSRALPDARDGLKPVQRRILFMMRDMGLRPEKGHVKSARVVGEVMGKLHPHGDASIYDALVRLAQDFTLRVPLVDGHGNFGSLDDGPAAARYTEARLAAAAMAMTEDLDEDVVDFVPNYDNQFMQPETLSAAYPNLLVNGSSGIAVGMATNMAPHNLVEVINAAKYLLSHPEASLAKLMSFVPGPDLPSGGTIMGLTGIAEAYETGRGSFKMRAKASIENVSARRVGIVFTELPYLIGPEKVIDKIKDGVTTKKLSGISNVIDLTDRHHGLKLVVEIKTGFNPEAVLEQLYRFTPLEDSFSINNVALVNGSPQTLGLKGLLEVYLDHRKTVVTRRSQFRLGKRRERLHLVAGLLIAIADIDEVIQVIRASDDADSARATLMTVFDLSQPQADYILELRLRRLTKFSRIELEKESAELAQEITELEQILASPERLIQVVGDELSATAQALGTPRRTELSDAEIVVTPARGEPEASLEVEDSPCIVTLSADGHLMRLDGTASNGWGLAKRTVHDALRSSVVTTRRSEIGAVTSRGRVVGMSPVTLPHSPVDAPSIKGAVDASRYVDVEKGETVVTLVGLTEGVLALGTAQGVVKRIDLATAGLRPGQHIISLQPGDAVVGATLASDAHWLAFITSDGQLLRFEAANVRPQGAGAGGMAGIKLSDGAHVVSFTAVSSTDDASVVTVSASLETLMGVGAQRVKVTPLSEFPAKGRATQGVRAHAFLKGEDMLTTAWAGRGPAHASDLAGKPVELPAELAKRDASGTKAEGDISFLGSHFSG